VIRHEFIGGIALGAGGVKGFPESGRHARRHGVKEQMSTFAQHVSQRSTLLLNGNCDRTAAEALVQFHSPKIHRFGCVV